MDELIKHIETAIHNKKALGFPAMDMSQYNVFRAQKINLDKVNWYYGYLYEACYLHGLFETAENFYIKIMEYSK